MLDKPKTVLGSRQDRSRSVHVSYPTANSQRVPLALKVVIASGMYMPLTVGQLCKLIMPSSSGPSLSEASSIMSSPHS